MTDAKPIPEVPAALCGLRPGLTFRVLVGGTMQTCTTIPTPAETGKVWALVAGTQIMALPLFGPEGVMDTGMLLLDSPLALCHAARWLAGRLGMEPGSTAPGWAFVPADDDGMASLTPAHFRLVGPDWVRVFTEEDGFNAQYFFGNPRPILRQTRNDAGVEAYEVHPWRPTTVPGILTMGPAKALAAACMALAPA